MPASFCGSCDRFDPLSPGYRCVRCGGVLRRITRTDVRRLARDPELGRKLPITERTLVAAWVFGARDKEAALLRAMEFVQDAISDRTHPGLAGVKNYKPGTTRDSLEYEVKTAPGLRWRVEVYRWMHRTREG